jgi:Fe-S cluster assembly protein SufD
MSLVPSAGEILRAQGIPHRRMEDWKYTDLRSVIDEAQLFDRGDVCISIIGAGELETFQYDSTERSELLQSLFPSTGVLDDAVRSGRIPEFGLRLPSGVRAENPLVLTYSKSGNAECVILLGENSSLLLAEEFDVENAPFQNIATRIILRKGARLLHVREASFSPHKVSIGTVSVHQEAGSIYRAILLQGGGRLSRMELNITLAGEGAEAGLSGVSVLGDGAHADTTTRIIHAVPNTTSRQLFKYIAGGKSRAIYQGKITVKEGAIGSDSRQTAKALLLSNHAEADLKPELEILADDVKCAHGAAVGDLDADSLFYLRSRGIPEKEARALLIEAFLQEVVDGIEDETIRISAADFVKEGLARAMSETP